MTIPRSAYPARPRSEVEALCPTPTPAPIDCRNERSRPTRGLYRTAQFDALALRSESANRRRKAREHGALERTFRSTGLSQDNVRSYKTSGR